MAKTLLSSLLVLAVVLGSGYGAYQSGYQRGFQDIQSQWKQQEIALAAKVSELEVVHAREQEERAHEARKLRESFLADLAGQRVLYEQRLSQSARRAQVYRDQAAGSLATVGDLAAHAAGLDRALEEGRGLVRELGSALGLCGHRLKLLGEQLGSDRRLVAEEL